MKQFLILLVFMCTASASAQYNYGNNMRRYGGVDRSLTGQNTKAPKKEKIDMVEQSMTKLNEELTLDSFQMAVIRQLLEENEEKEQRIVSEDIPVESKTEKIIAMREKLNMKIKEILNPEQKEKFDKMWTKRKK